MASLVATNIVAGKARGLDRVLEVFRRYRRDDVIPAMASIDAFFASQSAMTFATSLAQALLEYDAEDRRRKLDTERMKLLPRTFLNISFITFSTVVFMQLVSVASALWLSRRSTQGQQQVGGGLAESWQRFSEWAAKVLVGLCEVLGGFSLKYSPTTTAFLHAYIALFVTVFLVLCLQLNEQADRVVAKEVASETVSDLTAFAPLLNLMRYRDDGQRNIHGMSNVLLFLLYKTRVDGDVEIDKSTRCIDYSRDYPERAQTVTDLLRNPKIGCDCTCELGVALFGSSPDGASCGVTRQQSQPPAPKCLPPTTYDNLRWVATYVYDSLPTLEALVQRMDIKAQRRTFFGAHARLVRLMSPYAERLPESIAPRELDELAGRVVRVLTPPFVIFPTLRLRTGGSGCTSTESRAGGGGDSSCVPSERASDAAASTATESVVAAMGGGASRLVNAIAYDARAATADQAVVVVRRANANNVITVHVTLADASDVDVGVGSFVALREDDPQARLQMELSVPYDRLSRWVLDGDLVRSDGSLGDAARSVTVVDLQETGQSRNHPYLCSANMLRTILSSHMLPGAAEAQSRAIQLSVPVRTYIGAMGGSLARAATLNRLRVPLSKRAAAEVFPYVRAQLLSAETFLNYEVALRAKSGLSANDRSGALGEAYVDALKAAVDEVAAQKADAERREGPTESRDPYRPKREIVTYEEFRRRLGATQVREFFAEREGMYWVIAKLGIGARQLQTYYDKLASDQEVKDSNLKMTKTAIIGIVVAACLVLLQLTVAELGSTGFRTAKGAGSSSIMAASRSFPENASQQQQQQHVTNQQQQQPSQSPKVQEEEKKSSEPSSSAADADAEKQLEAEGRRLKAARDEAEGRVRQAESRLREQQQQVLLAANDAERNQRAEVVKKFKDEFRAARASLDAARDNYYGFLNDNMVSLWQRRRRLRMTGGGSDDGSERDDERDEDRDICGDLPLPAASASSDPEWDSGKIMRYSIAAAVIIAGASFFVSYIDKQRHLWDYNVNVINSNTRDVRSSFETAYNVAYNARSALLGLRSSPSSPQLLPPIGEEGEAAKNYGGAGVNKDSRRLAVDAAGEEQLRELYEALVRGIHSVDRCNAIASMATVALPFPTSKLVVQLLVLAICVACVFVVLNKMSVVAVVQRMRRLTALRNKSEGYGNIDARDYCYVARYAVFDHDIVTAAKLGAAVAAIGIAVFLAVEFSTGADYYKSGLYMTDAFAARSCVQA